MVADNKKEAEEKSTKNSKKSSIRRFIMLSVNKVVATLFLFYSYGAYAVDVSTLDISGIKLGMKKNEVLKKMPCSKPQSDTWKLENGKKHLFIIDCGSHETALDNFFRVFLDRNGSAYSITKKIVFNVTPDFPKIRKQFVNRYGEPKITTKISPGYKSPYTGFIKILCWGYCSVERVNDGYWEGSQIRNAHNFQLTASYKQVDEDGFYANSLIIDLDDPAQHKRNDNWANNENQKIEIQKKKEASNVDF